MNGQPFLRSFTAPAALCAIAFVAAMAAVLQFSLRAYVPGSLDPGGFTLNNFTDLLKPLYAQVFFDTVKICFLTALSTLIVGYPLAYALVRTPNAFLKSALQNIADGMDAEELRTLLEEQVATAEREQRAAAKFFNGLGGYAPTVGIIGTVISLTHVLEHLSNPATLGPSIAGAFVATLWGVLSANILWLPIGARLSRLADLNIERMHVLLEGVLAVQEGSQPRVVGERLRAMINVADKGKADKDSGAKGAKAVKSKPLKEAA